MTKYMGLIKHLIWAAVVVLLGAFTVMFFGTPEQADLVLGVLGGLAFFVIMVMFMVFVMS
jgi:hypothetical protein